MKLKLYFKKISDTIQFLAAVITLISYLAIGPKLTHLFSTIPSESKNVGSQAKTVWEAVGWYNSLLIFAIVFCLLFILLNVILTRFGCMVHFVKWRKTYRALSTIIVSLLMLWVCGVTYKIFFGGALFLLGSTLMVYKSHLPWCNIYALLCVAFVVATLIRVRLELEDIEQQKQITTTNTPRWKIKVWEEKW